MPEKLQWKHIFIPLVAGLLGVLLFAWQMTVSEERFPTVILDDLSEAVFTGGDRYDANRFRSLIYEPTLEIDGLDVPVRSIDVTITVLGHEEADYPQTMRVYLGDGSYTIYRSDAIHMALGTNRLVFDGSASVSSLRFDFTGMLGKLIDIEEIVINSTEHENLAFLAVAAAVFILAAMELSMFLTTAGAAAFSIGLAGCLYAGGMAVLATQSTGVQPFFLAVEASVCLLLFLLSHADFRRKDEVFAIAVMAAVFLFVLWWTLAAPYGEGCDEGMHYDVVRYIAKYGKLPRGDDPEIISSVWGFSYAFSPILPFIIGAGFQKILEMASDPTAWQLLLAARMVSVLSVTFTVYFISRTAKLLFPDSGMRHALPLAAGFYPGLLYLGTYVNCDAFAILTTAMILYFWARGCASRWKVRDACGLAVSMGLCALSYYNCYGFILMSVPLFFISCFQMKMQRKTTAQRTALIVALTLSICLWWFVRNGLLYGGDILGRVSLNRTAELNAMDGYRPSQLPAPQNQGLSFLYMVTEMGWLKDTLASFIGRFSTFSLQIKMPLVKAYLAVLGIGLAGNLISLWQTRKRYRDDPELESRRRTYFGCLLGTLAIPVILAALYSYTNDYQPQGRYMMPAILPLLIFVCQGLDEIENLVYKAIGRFRGGEEERECFASSAALSVFAAAAVCAVLIGTVYRFYV